MEERNGAVYVREDHSGVHELRGIALYPPRNLQVGD